MRTNSVFRMRVLGAGRFFLDMIKLLNVVISRLYVTCKYTTLHRNESFFRHLMLIFFNWRKFSTFAYEILELNRNNKT